MLLQTSVQNWYRKRRLPPISASCISRTNCTKHSSCLRRLHLAVCSRRRPLRTSVAGSKNSSPPAFPLRAPQSPLSVMHPPRPRIEDPHIPQGVDHLHEHPPPSIYPRIYAGQLRVSDSWNLRILIPPPYSFLLSPFTILREVASPRSVIHLTIP